LINITSGGSYEYGDLIPMEAGTLRNSQDFTFSVLTARFIKKKCGIR